MITEDDNKLPKDSGVKPAVKKHTAIEAAFEKARQRKVPLKANMSRDERKNYKLGRRTEL